MAVSQITTAIQNTIAQDYISILGRNPDSAGFGYWTNALANAGGTTAANTAIVNGFSIAPEFVAIYGGQTTAGAVNLMYNNILGRNADATGSTYWQGVANALIASGTTIAQAYAQTASQMITAAAANTGTADATLITTKTAAAVAQGTIPGVTTTLTTNGTGATFTTGVAVPAGQLVLNDIGAGPAANANADTVLTLSMPTGASVASSYLTINGTAATAAAGFYEDVTADTSGSAWASVNNLTVNGSGVETITVAKGTTVTATSAAAGVTVNGAGSVTVVDKGATVIGTTTAVTGAVSVTNKAAAAANVTVDGGTTVSVTDSGAGNTGTITIGAAGTLNTAQTALTAASAANIATGNVTVKDFSTNATTGQQTPNSGAVTVFTNGANTVSITGGGTGSAVTDVATTTSTVTGTSYATSNLSTVILDAVAGTTTLTSDALTALSVLDSGAGGTLSVTPASTVNITNLTAGALNLTVGTGSITLNDPTTAGTAPTSETAIVNDPTATSIVLATAGTTAVNVTLNNETKMTSFTGNQTTKATVDFTGDAALTTITDNGSGALVLTGTSGLTKLTTINASGATGGVTVTLGNTQNFTGGTGNDVVTLTGSYAGTAAAAGGTNTVVFNDTPANWATFTQAGGGLAGLSGFTQLGLVNNGTYNIAGTGINAAVSTANTHNYVVGGFGSSAILIDTKYTVQTYEMDYTVNGGSLVANIGTDTTSTTGALTANIGTLTLSTALTGAALTAATTAHNANALSPLNGVSSITINSAGITLAQVAAGGNAATNTVSLTDDALTTLTINGDSNIVVSNNAPANSLVTTINAAAATGNVDVSAVTGAVNATETITGGAGLLTAVGTTLASTNVTAGTGGLFFTLGAAADAVNLTASTVVDTVSVANGTSLNAAQSVITGFTNYATKTTAGDLSDGLQFSSAPNQIDTVTVGGTVAVGDVFSVTINGVTASFTATATTIANVTNGLFAATTAAFGGTAVTHTADAATLVFTASGAGVQDYTPTVAKTSAAGTIADATTAGTGLHNIGDQANATATTLTGMTYTSSKGVITFGGTVGTLAQEITAALALVGGAIDQVAAFQAGTTTYVVESTHAANSATNGSVVDLVGVSGITSLGHVAGAHVLIV